MKLLRAIQTFYDSLASSGNLQILVNVCHCSLLGSKITNSLERNSNIHLPVTLQFFKTFNI